MLGHFGHGHFGHGRFGQDISATDISATDISANGHFGHGHFGHGKNTYFLLLQMEFNRLLPFNINMFDHLKQADTIENIRNRKYILFSTLMINVNLLNGQLHFYSPKLLKLNCKK